MPDVMPFSSALWLAAGLLAGVVHVMALWTNVQWLVSPDRRLAAVAIMGVRFIALAVLLTLAARSGTQPLLLAGAGILIARPLTLRLMRRRLNETDLSASRKGAIS
ncbi:N-ATPase subunit AtpR [Acetobacter conturbans]|uniref:ATP synthase subunit I n=1 Tax=Acetobacter conturbans TaxID=1737472 RepID=A0ABX0JZG5_9PROT|nr:ATP synthase subunit I [Acetobacter conturbans]NHN87820.1 hypothetical protein [Acetobacter conturbans]